MCGYLGFDGLFFGRADYQVCRSSVLSETEHSSSTNADLHAARPIPVMNLVLRQSCDMQPPGLGCTFQLMTCLSTCLTATALDQQACSGFDQTYKHLHWQNLIDLKM